MRHRKANESRPVNSKNNCDSCIFKFQCPYFRPAFLPSSAYCLNYKGNLLLSFSSKKTALSKRKLIIPEDIKAWRGRLHEFDQDWKGGFQQFGSQQIITAAEAIAELEFTGPEHRQ
jgi:hypothetical protein